MMHPEMKLMLVSILSVPFTMWKAGQFAIAYGADPVSFALCVFLAQMILTWMIAMLIISHDTQKKLREIYDL